MPETFHGNVFSAMAGAEQPVSSEAIQKLVDQTRDSFDSVVTLVGDVARNTRLQGEKIDKLMQAHQALVERVAQLEAGRERESGKT